MNKEFIPYEQALELKELGFDEKCLARYFKDGKSIFYTHSKIYKDYVSAPLYQQAFRWFRENGLLNSHIEYISASNQYQWHIKHYWETFATYEEAELACLKKLIEIVRNK